MLIYDMLTHCQITFRVALKQLATNYFSTGPHSSTPTHSNNQLLSRQTVVFGSELIHLETKQATSPIMKGENVIAQGFFFLRAEKQLWANESKSQVFLSAKLLNRKHDECSKPHASDR